MGQGASTNLATYSLLSTAPDATSHDPLAELGREVTYERSIGSSRCLRAIKGRQQRPDGLATVIIVKVFFKPSTDVSLKPFSKRLKKERDALQDLPNILPYARILETERAGYVLRPWIASSLYDRISTRPFLNLLEKKWITFQLLTALTGARRQGVAHGDIKSENVLVTHSLWVYLTDFSSPFKPTLLPLDDPAEFSYFFDSSGRRTCYLAPERFFPSTHSSQAKSSNGGDHKTPKHVTEAMDVFSTGCVLAELFCDGVPPFSLSQLFRYRNGEYRQELDTYLSQIEDKDVMNMCRTMLSPEPADRGTFTEHLESPNFPSFFPALHEFFASLQQVMLSSPPSLPQASATSTSTPLPGSASAGRMVVDAGPRAEQVLHTSADDVFEHLTSDWSGVVRFFGPSAPQRPADGTDEPEEGTSGLGSNPFPMRLAIPGFEITMPDLGSTSSPQHDDPAALLMLSFISANIRNCLRPSCTVQGLEQMLYLSRLLTDETVLDRILPYVVYFLCDEAAVVRSMAIRSLTQLLLLVEIITPANIAVIMDYVVPNIRPLATDPAPTVRTTYAWCLAPISDCGERFMSMMGKVRAIEKSTGARDELDDAALETSYDAKMEELRDAVQEQLSQLLLTDNEPAVRRAILTSVVPLCFFFGRSKSADVLLSHMVTCLNEMDWQLRSTFFDSAVGVVSYIGLSAVEDVILPLMLQALADPEESVASKVLLSLTTLSELGLIPRARVWELLDAVTNLVCHPNIWIRQAAAGFIASLANNMEHTDVWSALYPPLRRLLRADLESITEQSILDIVASPLSRLVYEAAVAWASKAKGRSAFWNTPTEQRSNRNAGLLPASMQKTADQGHMLSEEDTAELDRLRQLGLTTQDEMKLDAMRRHIVNVSAARQNVPAKDADVVQTFLSGVVSLRKLNVTPSNILLSKPSGPSKDASGPLLSPREIADRSGRRAESLASAFNPELHRVTRNFSDSSAIEDLRKRLASGAGGSTASLTEMAKQQNLEPETRSPADFSSEGRSPNLELQSPFTSPVAPAKPKPLSRLSQQGVALGRASPALGKDLTAALGENNLQSRPSFLDEDPVSGVVSPKGPLSVAQSTAASYRPTKRFNTNYEGRDPTIRLLLERTFQEHAHQSAPEFGPVVARGVPKKRAIRNSLLAREKSSQPRPDGTLIGHLAEHTGAITGLVASPDNVFFVSASEDGTARVWDAMRLERNVTSRSRQTMQLDQPVSAICRLENTHCIALATVGGSLSIHRVIVKLDSNLPKYEKPQLVRHYTFDQYGEYATAMTHLTQEGTSLLLCATSLSNIRVFDLTTMREIKTFQLPPHFGAFTTVCLDAKQCWVAAGTALGYLALFDLRFDLLLKTIKLHSDQCPRKVLACSVHPSKGKGRYLLVSLAGGSPSSSSLATWDIENDVKVEEYFTKTRHYQETPEAGRILPSDESLSSAASAIERFLEAQQRQPPFEENRDAVCALVVGSDYTTLGDNQRASSEPTIATASASAEDTFMQINQRTPFLLTGGEDRQVRFWNLSNVGQSSVLLSPDDSKGSSFSQQSGDSGSLTVVQEAPSPEPPKLRPTIIAQSQQNMLRAHQDAITAAILLQLPYKTIITGDRKGVIKVCS